MFSSLWKWLAVGFAAIGTIAVAAAYAFRGQRDMANAKLEETKDKLAVTDATRAKENNIAQAQHEAEVKSNEIEQESQDRPSGTRPSGVFRR